MVHSLLVSRPNKTNPALSGQEHKVSFIYTQIHAIKYIGRSPFKKNLSHSTVKKNIHLTIATLTYFLLYGHVKISDASICFFSSFNLISPISIVLVDNDNSNIIRNMLLCVRLHEWDSEFQFSGEQCCIILCFIKPNIYLPLAWSDFMRHFTCLSTEYTCHGQALMSSPEKLLYSSYNII